MKQCIPLSLEKAASLFLKESDREFLLGDFSEMYWFIEEKDGVLAARIWYLSTVIKLFCIFIKTGIGGGFTMLKSNLKTSFRNIRKKLSFSIINVTGLTVGLLCAIVLALWVNYEFSYDKFHKNIDSVYRVYISFPSENGIYYNNPIPGAVAEHIGKNMPEVAAVTNYMKRDEVVAYGKQEFMCNKAFVFHDFFEIFSFPVLQGDRKSFLKDPSGCILEERTAIKIFGNRNPVGELLNGKYRIDGVVRVPENSSLTFDILFSYEILPQYYKKWRGMCTKIFLKLKDGSSAADLSSKLRDVYNNRVESDKDFGLFIQPFSKYHLYSPGDDGGAVYYVYGFIALGFFILLIACINFSNLSTARAATRCKEVGIKKVLGAGRMSLINQFLAESVILSGIAFVFAVAASIVVVPLLNSLISVNLWAGLNFQTIVAAAVITLLTGLCSGIYPALFLSSIPFNKSFSTRGKSGENTRKVLIILQFALATFFITGAYILYSQIDYLLNKDPGFHKRDVLAVNVSKSMGSRFDIVKKRLLNDLTVRSVTRAETTFTDQHHSDYIIWEGKRTHSPFAVEINDVDSDYFRLFDLKLITGRFFQKDSLNDRREGFVINRAAADAIGVDNPVGLRITYGPWGHRKKEGVVLGVVENYHTSSMHNRIRPKILTYGDSGTVWYIRFGSGAGSLAGVQSLIRELAPGGAFNCVWLDDLISSEYRNEKVTGALLSYITAAAVIISCLGLFSFASFMVAGSRKSIGVRKVLGASVRGIVFRFLMSFLKLVTVAVSITLPFSFYTGKWWLGFFEYRIGMDALHFIIPALIICTLAIVAVISQAMRAGTVDPVKVLSDE